MIPKQIDHHMRASLIEAIRILFPLGIPPEQLVARHAWGNRRYVGETRGAVVTWRGWRANLAKIDTTYHGIHFDYVENRLPLEERVKLFGEDFSCAIDPLESFVVAFAGGLSHNQHGTISNCGFVVRVIGRNLHACIIASPSDFLDMPTLYWAAKISRLINLQRTFLASDLRQAQSSRNLPKRPNWIAELEWEEELWLLDL